MPVSAIDHVALPTAGTARLIAFYRALGFSIEGEEAWIAGDGVIVGIVCGSQKINLRTEVLDVFRSHPAVLAAPTAEPGCGDLCFVWEGGVADLLATLERLGIPPVFGPVRRAGGRGVEGASVYCRDPDENLVEFISYLPADVEAAPPDRTERFWEQPVD